MFFHVPSNKKCLKTAATHSFCGKQLNKMNSLRAFDSLGKMQLAGFSAPGASEFSGLLLAISVLIKRCVNGALRQNSLRVVSNKCVC